MKDKVIVLGGGIQGITCTLALESVGYEVVLIDKADQLFSRASLRNEGKIHLGFVYANDGTFNTAALMLQSSLQFAPLLEKWIKPAFAWEDLLSRKFSYIIHKDSMLSRDELFAHYARLDDQYQAYKSSGHYLGQRPDRIWQEPDLADPLLSRDKVAYTVATEERAVDRNGLKRLLLASLESPRIRIELNRTVKQVRRTSYGFEVEVETSEGKKWTEEGAIVVNCLWDNRLHIDGTLGIAPWKKEWVHRLKYRILGRLPAHLSAMQSYTLVLGPFGDVVTYPSGVDTYLSWYPSCMRGWSRDILPPAEWEAACRGIANPNDPWVKESLTSFAGFFPGLDQFQVQQVDAGVIFSWGKSDIDDYESQLHTRDHIGIHSHDGYYSLDTGKFTSAPMFAQQLVQKM